MMRLPSPSLLLLSGALLLSASQCSSTPAPAGTDQAVAHDLLGRDLSGRDMASRPSGDMPPHVPDLEQPGCRHGQQMTGGTCTCVAAAPTQCTTPVTYCCTAAQSCLGSMNTETIGCSPPAGRQDFAMAHDPVRGATLVFGGLDNTGTVVAQPWELDSTWGPVSATAAPSPRSFARAVYDGTTARILLFGGQTSESLSTTAVADTYTWNGSVWVKQAPARSPSARAQVAMAYNGQSVIQFGGNDPSGNDLGETWSWNGSTWAPLTTNTVPAAREGAEMVYDKLHGVIFMHGGFVGSAANPYVAENWTFNGMDWKRVLPDTPGVPGRSYFAMAYDELNQQVVVFSGEVNVAGSAPAITLVWDGAKWTNKSPATTPPGRSRHKMVWDTRRQRVVMFGGADNQGNQLDDAWAWDGNNWTQLYANNG